MSDPRLSRLAAAFRETRLTLGGRELRRPTAGSINLLMEIGNPLFAAEDTGEGGGGLSDAQALRGVMEFAWIHSVEIAELEGLPLDPQEMRDHVARRVRAFGMAIDFEDLQAFASDFAALRERLEAAATEAAETGSAPGKPAATPPTGLPAWSSPSAEQATPPASDTSFGNSPSSGLSNTSTPPTSTTAAPAAGPSTSMEEDLDPMPAPPS